MHLLSIYRSEVDYRDSWNTSESVPPSKGCSGSVNRGIFWNDYRACTDLKALWPLLLGLVT